MQLGGCDIVLAHADHDSEFDLHLPITPEIVEEHLRKDPSIEAVYVTTPTYEGFCSNV